MEKMQINEPQSQQEPTVEYQKKGVIKFPNGDKYFGDLIDGKPYGKGETTYSNRDRYKGEHVEGKRHGDGTLTKAQSGHIYKGSWVEDKLIHGTVDYKEGIESGRID